ncbi:MAG TPA: hypothetical protein VFR19_16100 [Hyphomicrobiaceae bacterium]|jgi:hypothetical protein|nr:hypothetical protein [Hyphomicrobiaceae bacterium]
MLQYSDDQSTLYPFLFLTTPAMVAARAPSPLDHAIRQRLDRSRALVADLEQIWAREKAELLALAPSWASHPCKLAFRRALVMRKHWSQERQIHDELIRLCAFVRAGG